MVDIIVRDEQMLEKVAPGVSIPATQTRAIVEPRFYLSRAATGAIGLICVAILLAYFVAGSVGIEAGPRTGVRYRVATIWSDFVAYLTRQGASLQLVILVTCLAVASVIGSCLLIGLAFATRDDGIQSQ